MAQRFEFMMLFRNMIAQMAGALIIRILPHVD